MEDIKEKLENLLKRHKELEAEVESQDKTIDKLVEEQEEREKYTHSLEEENKELKNNYINPSKARISYYDTKKGTEVVIEGFIPISVIQNTLKEIDNRNYNDYTNNQDGNEVKNNILKDIQELLEERNK